jgi:hypothetical protein
MIKLGGKLLFNNVQVRNWINQNSCGYIVIKQPAGLHNPPLQLVLLSPQVNQPFGGKINSFNEICYNLG